ncbi:hypothetical protein ACW9TO_47145, partial [Streptomyces sp. ATMOS53]
MSDSPNLALVRRLYDSGMAPDVVAEVIDPDIVWDITPGFPYGGVYKTWASAGGGASMSFVKAPMLVLGRFGGVSRSVVKCSVTGQSLGHG